MQVCTSPSPSRTTSKVRSCYECDQYDPKLERERLKEGIKGSRENIHIQQGVLDYAELTRKYGDREKNKQDIESQKEVVKTLKNELADWKNKLANWEKKGKKWKEANEKFRDCVKKCLKKTITGDGTTGGKNVVTGGGTEDVTIFESLLKDSHDSLKQEIRAVDERSKERDAKLTAEIRAVGEKVDGHEARISALEQNVA